MVVIVANQNQIRRMKRSLRVTNGRTLLGMTPIHPIGASKSFWPVILIGTYRLQRRLVKDYQDQLPESCYLPVS